MVDDRSRPTPLVRTSRNHFESSPSWSQEPSFGGDPHPSPESVRVYGGRSDRSSSNTEVFDTPTGQGAAPGLFDLVQRQQVQTYVPLGSQQ